MKYILTKYADKVKEGVEDNENTIFLGLALCFGVIFVAGLVQVWQMRANTGPILMQDTGPLSAAALEADMRIFASKNGTRYYYPWCGGLGRIKEKNLVSFATPADAEAAGYTIASGCEGL